VLSARARHAARAESVRSDAPPVLVVVAHGGAAVAAAAAVRGRRAVAAGCAVGGRCAVAAAVGGGRAVGGRAAMGGARKPRKLFTRCSQARQQRARPRARTRRSRRRTRAARRSRPARRRRRRPRARSGRWGGSTAPAGSRCRPATLCLPKDLQCERGGGAGERRQRARRRDAQRPASSRAGIAPHCGGARRLPAMRAACRARSARPPRSRGAAQPDRGPGCSGRPGRPALRVRVAKGCSAATAGQPAARGRSARARRHATHTHRRAAGPRREGKRPQTTRGPHCALCTCAEGLTFKRRNATNANNGDNTFSRISAHVHNNSITAAHSRTSSRPEHRHLVNLTTNNKKRRERTIKKAP
jgi:hypothetical protein